MDLIHKKQAEQMCKSFINPFLHKLSHKQYSDGISFLKDLSYNYEHSTPVIFCTDLNGIGIFVAVSSGCI